MHPMYIDGPVQCFAQFQNVNCPQGFLYFNVKVRKTEALFQDLFEKINSAVF